MEENNQPSNPLMDKLNEETEKWNNIIADLSNKLKNVRELPDVMSEVYVHKQNAADYKKYLSSVLADLKRKYDQRYATAYNKYKVNSNIMYKSDSGIDRQIVSDLADERYKINVISDFIDFIDTTMSSIDGISYAVQHRIRLEEFLHGK